jgi:D-aspartate ligase
MKGLATVPPALLLGTSYTVLGTARSLGHCGIPAYSLSTKLGYINQSRWCSPLPGSPDIHEFDDLTGILAGLKVDRGVLFPCSDHWASQIAHLDPSWSARFPAIVPTADTIDILLDKGKLSAALQKFDFPAPLTRPLESDEDLDRWPSDRWASAMIKPCNSQKFMSIFFRKALRVSSKEQALARLAKVRSANVALLLQEYIPGPAMRHYFVDGYVDAKGSVRAMFARQRLRMFPLDFGDSSCMISVGLETFGDLPDRLARLLGQLNYRGIFSAEFKFDDRDKQYKLLEINVRPWLYIGFTSDCGVNVAELAYRDALGKELPKVGPYRVGVGFVTINKDRRAIWAGIKKGRLPLFHWLWSWFWYRKAIFVWDDPLPVIMHYMTRLGLSRATK